MQRKYSRGVCSRNHDIILKLSASNTLAEISKIIDVPATTLYGYCKRNNIELFNPRVCIEDYKSEIVSLAKNGYNISQIAEKLNLLYGSLFYYIKENRIAVVNGNDNPNAFDHLKYNERVFDLYNKNYTYIEIAKELDIPYKWVPKCLDAMRVEKRTSAESFDIRNGINHSAFSEINENSAYWLGWLVTDGCVSDKGSVSLSLNGGDVKLVEQFRDYIKPTANVTVKEYFHKQTNKVVSSATLSVRSSKIAEDLNYHNIHPRKSCKEKLPRFDWLYSEFAPVFWRAIIEGDGSVRFKSSTEISLVGSEELLNGFKMFAENICGVKTGKTIRKRNYGNPDFRLISYTGDDCRSIVSKLWSCGTIFLERKQIIAAEILRRANNKQMGSSICPYS